LAIALSPVPTPWGAPQASMLSSNRLHLQHGPIDLIIKAEGEPADVVASYQAATARFQNVLGELVSELGLLRQPLSFERPALQSPVALRMLGACWPHKTRFITPMAAVAGAVADEILSAMLQILPKLQTAFVNNGGDIACYANKGHSLRIGMVNDLLKAAPEGFITIDHTCGVATSGWRGRSFSLGIADAVTVVANNASMADAAATIIANAVNIDNETIIRQPAQSLDPDSDLGDLLVTMDVALLCADQVETALLNAVNVAENLLDQNLIEAAVLSLQGRWHIVQSKTAKLLP
jgi:uncharacterized protein